MTERPASRRWPVSPATVATAGIVLLAVSTPAFAQGNDDDVDHAGIIRSWTDANRERGRRIYDAHCYSCHGYDGTSRLPDARSFNTDEFRAGSDPYSMWQTLTEGFGQMVPQTQYTPEERYDVVHFIREVLVRGRNREQYFEVTDEYLASLPEGTRKVDLTVLESHPRDHGPVLTSQFRREINRAMTFDLGNDVFVTYDLHRMRQHHAWDGWLDLTQTQHMRYRGERQPIPSGEPFDGLQIYHWAFGEGFEPAPENSLMAGLENGKSMGPTDPELMTYRGHYLDGRTATLSFTVLGREVLDRPRAHRSDTFTVLENVLHIGPGTDDLHLAVGGLGNTPDVATIVPFESVERDRVARAPTDVTQIGAAAGSIALAAEFVDDGSFGRFSAAMVAGDTEGLEWHLTADDLLVLRIAAQEIPQTLRVLRFAGNGDDAFLQAHDYSRIVVANGLSTAPDLTAVLDGGAPRWDETLVTQGTLDVRNTRYDPIDYRRTEGVSPFRVKDRPRLPWPDRPTAYVHDDIALPDDNPWNAWMRMSALDFFDDGRMAVATLGGDVWVVSGIDADLERVEWRRFATGLFEPLGVKVIDGTIYVTVRDGVLRLHDLNGDGEADYYEDFYADPDVSSGFHAYNFDLDTDSEGNLYYVKPGRYTDYSQPGGMLKLSPDGELLEVIARGFRVPNGMGIDPANDTIFVSGQEGQWVPASKITIVPQTPGVQQWLGVSQRAEPDFDTFVQPFIWMPRELDNSTAAMEMARDSRFGPLDGKLLHVSFGKGWAYYSMMEEVDATTQGAVVALPFQFDSGVQRLRFNPADGQLYLVGLTGWDAESTERDGSLSRIRYTGSPAYLLTQTHARPDGIDLTFSFDLDPTSTPATSNYVVERWNYEWTASYGSQHYSVSRPGEVGHDEVRVESAELGEDGRTLRLRLADMRPAHQMMIRMDLTAADGTPYKEVVYLTVHRLPEADTDPD
jgi:mono/diheme cytochrome c family protein